MDPTTGCLPRALRAGACGKATQSLLTYGWVKARLTSRRGCSEHVLVVPDVSLAYVSLAVQYRPQRGKRQVTASDDVRRSQRHATRFVAQHGSGTARTQAQAVLERPDPSYALRLSDSGQSCVHSTSEREGRGSLTAGLGEWLDPSIGRATIQFAPLELPSFTVLVVVGGVSTTDVSMLLACLTGFACITTTVSVHLASCRQRRHLHTCSASLSSCVDTESRGAGNTQP